MDTKVKIEHAALELFNSQGLASVSMRDISGRVGISVGNLTYHFHSKDDLVHALLHNLTGEVSGFWEKVKLKPTLDNIDKHIGEFANIQKKYCFVFLDLLELRRRYPKLGQAYKAQSRSSVASVRSIIEYSVGVGNMQPEPMPGVYEQLAQTVWLLVIYWFSQREIRGTDSEPTASTAIWSLVVPHLTQQGIDIFDQVFGQRFGICVPAQEVQQ